MRVLVTGGAGYIGSHTCVALLEAGYDVTVIDNLSNSSEIALERVQEITGKPLTLIRGDIRNPADLGHALSGGADAVIHFAALKAVGESCEKPLEYFDNNIGGTITLLRMMSRAGVRRLVFSSSATVYGEPTTVPVTERAPLRVTNPYGRTKLVMEDLIRDCCQAAPSMSAVVLRYFNPVGAHASGRIGEDPRGAPSNLMPYLAQVAVGRHEKLRVFGGDYPTRDGTGIRDYVHVVDLAHAHIRALSFIATSYGWHGGINVGTGRGYSVLEVLKAFERASGARIPFEIVPRRPGDVPELWADPALASRLLGWRARRGLAAMCEDTWRWQSNNPGGFDRPSPRQARASGT